MGRASSKHSNYGAGNTKNDSFFNHVADKPGTRQVSGARNSKFNFTFNNILLTDPNLTQNSVNRSNSNLFVFKNGWTSTNKDATANGPMFRQRPQSSNQFGKRPPRNHLGSGGPSSDKRIWKYN